MANLQNPSLDTPSTSGDSTGCCYDIFINHRGPDLKNTFVSHLYHCLLSHALRPFLDREELQEGEFLTPQIEGAIRSASLHIAIFSPRYAESRWCLDELVLIRKSGATIIPVFYNVKPHELRWTGTGQYAEAFSSHEQKGRYDRETLENWKEALSHVSSISGFELEACNGDEWKLLDDVLKCVRRRVSKIGLDVARYPTGLQEKVQEFEKTVLWNQRQSGKVEVMGIVGMGGLGKTTLAKHLFNKEISNFDKSCFLFDVRDNAVRRSLNTLQTKLIKDLVQIDVEIDHVDKGIEMLRTHLRTSQHALVVLDDVDHPDQLHAFLPIKDVLPSDSLILVTSRDKDVLTSSGIAEASIYNLTGLNEQYSQQLFCLHAFCQPHPTTGFKVLVDEFCRACDGLPLSLKVFGALLCEKRDKSYWKGLLDKLRLTKLPNEILQRLKLSYDALERDEKQIFLDIACYFIGEDMDMAIRIWDGSGWSGLVGLLNLQAKCLVEVDGANTLKMHDHLRDMGRQIADEEKSSGVIPHRLWRVIEDIPDLWQRSSVITEVRGIRTVDRIWEVHRIKLFPSSYAKSGNSSWFKSWRDQVLGNRLRKLNDRAPYSFSNLQLVATRDGDLKSILRRVESPNLIWLRWQNCPYTCLPSWITMKNTRVLEVSGNLKRLWRRESQAPLELRELTIYSPLLKFPKSIGQLKHIEKIVVKGSNLKSLPEEFCQLRLLKYLDLSDSELLQMLPDAFGNLIHLKHLNLSCCASLALSEETFANITTLEYLNLGGCRNVGTLPPEVAHQLSLEYLSVYVAGLKEFPEDIGNLRSLEVLEVESPLLKMLPCSLGTLSSLKELRIYRCPQLKSLPESLGMLTQLSTLEVKKCGIESLPDSLGLLTQLSTLEIGSALLKMLPCSLGTLSSLKELMIVECPQLKSLPDSLGLLTQLSELVIKRCEGLELLPAEVVKLNNLVTLRIEGCPLRELPLKKVVEGERGDIELSRLESLHIKGTKVSEISFIEGVCPTLKHLTVMFCDDLVEVGALPPTLTKLSISDCGKLRKMEGLWNLTNLQHLDIDGSRKVEELPGLERLISLKEFRANRCSKLKRIAGLGQQHTELQKLRVYSCVALEEMASVEDLKSLEYLDIRNCPKLQWGEGVMKQLRKRLKGGLRE